MSERLRINFGDLESVNITSIHKKGEEYHCSILSIMDLSIVTLGILANILTLVVVLRSRFRQTAFGVHLAWMSSADMCVLITHTCLVVIRHTKLTCQVFNFIDQLALLLSSWSLVTLAIERMLAVYFPHRIRFWCTARKAMVVQIGWLIVLMLVCIGAPFTSRIRTTVTNEVLCYMTHKDVGFHPNVTYKVLLYSIVPFCLLLIMNCALVIGLRRSEKFRKRSACAASSAGFNLMRTTVMLIMTSIMFVLTTLPVSLLVTGIVCVCDVHPEDCDQFLDKLSVLSDYLFRLQDFNHAGNFFVYFLTGSEFRAEVFAMCRCFRKVEFSHSSTTGRSGISLERRSLSSHQSNQGGYHPPENEAHIAGDSPTLPRRRP